MWLLLTLTPAFLLPTPRPAASAYRPGHQPRTMLVTMNHYATLGVERSATAAQIKQAYRRLALRNHPDVNKAPDAQETFAKIAEAYSVLGDTKQRTEYDRTPQGRGSSAGYGGSTTGGRSSSSGSSSASASDRAAYAERRRASREPTPDELGDSFGALLGDLIGAVGKVVAGGDWIELLDDLQADGPELQTLLRSRDVSVLRDELDEAKWVEGRLRARQQRLREEARAPASERVAPIVAPGCSAHGAPLPSGRGLASCAGGPFPAATGPLQPPLPCHLRTRASRVRLTRDQSAWASRVRLAHRRLPPTAGARGQGGGGEVPRAPPREPERDVGRPRDRALARARLGAVGGAGAQRRPAAAAGADAPAKDRGAHPRAREGRRRRRRRWRRWWGWRRRLRRRREELVVVVVVVVGAAAGAAVG